MKRNAWNIAAAVCLLAAMALPAGAATIGYQGRLVSNGSNYNGTAYGKYQIYGATNDILWANDGNLMTGEPSTSLVMAVNNGLYNIELGMNGAGNTGIPWNVFHEPFFTLRSWVSTDGASFQQLAPDVVIRPMSIEKINTGGSIIVDDESGAADFTSIEAALQFAGDNPQMVEHILVMPGIYSLDDTLVLPTNDNESVHIKGLGNPDDTTMVNSNDVAVYAGNAIIENVHIGGLPALSDNAPPEYDLLFKNCRLDGLDYQAVGLNGPGYTRFFDCEIVSDTQPALTCLMDSEIELVHCEVSTAGTNKNAMELYDRAAVTAESSTFRAEIGYAVAFMAMGPDAGDLEMLDCDLRGGIKGENTKYRGDLTGCYIECRSNQNGAVFFNNYEGDLDLKDCTITGVDAPAIYLGGSITNCSIDATECSIGNYGDFMGPMIPAVVVTNLWNTPRDSTQLDLQLCTVDSRIGIGVLCCEARAEIRHSTVRSGDYYDGLRVSSGDVEVVYSCINGLENGITMMGESEVEVISSSVEGWFMGIDCRDSELNVASSHIVGDDSDGISAVDYSHVSIERSTITGADGFMPMGGSGIMADLSLDRSSLVVLHSKVQNFSEEPALDATGGAINYLAENWFISEGGYVVSIAGTNMFWFDHDKFLISGDSNTNAVIELAWDMMAGGPPEPHIIGCTFRSFYTGTTAFAVSGAPSGNVVMVDNYLGVGFNTNLINFLPVDDTTLPYDNVLGP